MSPAFFNNSAEIRRVLQVSEKTLLDNWTKRSQYIADQLKRIPGLAAKVRMTAKGYADVVFTWDEKLIPVTWQQASAALLNGAPPISYMPGRISYAYEGPTIVPASLKNGEEVIVAKRLRQYFLEEARKRGSAPSASR